MKKYLLLLCTACLFLAFTTPNSTPANYMENTLQTFVVHSFHYETTGSDGHTYYVTLDFNLATQQFGVITAHDVLYPNNELDATLNSGYGDTTGGNGSTIVTTSVSITIDNTSVTISIPDNQYTFDY
jgi:hypothetical protein